ncbi:hypothetical protein [Domibacillus tundrae]|uniref:hypothetical protein n=1 Tax=Domibacillus tundrae TaxID=1587527 RepID=UPI00339412B3
MANVVEEQSYQRKSALTAGISLIIMTLAAFFSMALFLEDLWFKVIPAPLLTTPCRPIRFFMLESWAG